MNKNLLGVIDATTTFHRLEQLLGHRCLAALPFGGRYRLVDFIMSSMVNSGIKSVAVFPKVNYRSLMDHLGSGKNWDLNRKRDGLFLFPPTLFDKLQGQENNYFNHLASYIDFFYRSRQEYALLANCFTVSIIDFKKVLEKHIQSNCDITQIVRKDGTPLKMYVLKTSLLVSLVESRKITGYRNIDDVISDIGSPYDICTYEYEGRAEMIDSIQSYYYVSMELLKPETWLNFFPENRPIYTKIMDEAPTRYGKRNNVKNSMIANGCQIDGTVENSIIFRGVKIAEGAVVKNSIIMQRGNIEKGCYLDSVILDKDTKIKRGAILKGSERHPQVIGKGMVVLQGAVMRV